MAVSIIEALEIIGAQISALSCEIIPIEESLGRVIAADQRASFDLPRFDNSAMDGYGVMCCDHGKSIPGNKQIFAGDQDQYTLSQGEAIRIMTGAPIPDGCEAIVPIEEVTIGDDSVLLPANIRLGAHIRRAGEDIKTGERYIKKGERVTAYTIAMLASQGMTHIPVIRKVKVAVFGTGDELRAHHEKILPHQLYNSNTPMFAARAKELGCQASAIAGSADTIEALKSSIQDALYADLVITSGGVSVGDKDFTLEAFEQLGMKRLFSGVNIKPGKPTTVGKIGDTVIVNLPGNPLAAMINFEMFVKIIILKLSGNTHCYHGTIKTKMGQTYKLKSGKYTVILGNYDGSGFMPLSKQSPGMVSPLAKADGMIIVSPELSMLEDGGDVSMIPIRWSMHSSQKKDIFTK